MSVFEKGSWRVAVRRGGDYADPLGEQTRLFIMWRGPEGKKAVKSFEMEDMHEGVGLTAYPQYFESDNGDHEELIRAVMNAAWEAGIRPDGYNDTRRETEALKAHLNDFRHLVFKRNPFGADT